MVLAALGRCVPVFYSTVTLRFDVATSRFDDGPLSEFSKGKDLLAVREHFFEHGGLPHLLICVSWRMPPAGAARAPSGGEDWRGLLTTPEASDRFDRIRRWRNETARKEGKPAYAILTNRQAAEVAVLPAPSRAALAGVDGIGPARIEQYAPALLELLGVAPGSTGRG